MIASSDRSLRSSLGASAVGLVVLVAALTAPAQVDASRFGPYQYLSPLPGARAVPASHNIVIRDGRAIAAGSLGAASLSVTGAESGEHSGTLVLSDDGRTLVFTPDVPFAFGEVVDVRMNRGPRTSDGATLPPLAFDFTVSTIDPRQGRPASLHGSTEPVAVRNTPRVPVLDPEGVQRPLTTAALDLPPDYPDIFVMSSDNPEPGEIFLTPFGFSAPPPPNNRGPMVIVDNLGMPLFFHPLNLGGLTLTPQQGKLTFWDHSRERFFVMDDTYAVIDSFWAKNGYFDDHHDLQLLPNGHVLITAGENRPVAMDELIDGGDPNALVEGAVVQELDLAKNVVWEWRSLDYIDILDGDPKSVNFLGPLVKYFVINAVELDHDGNVLISSRYLNQVIKVDRQTGEVIWRFGVHGKHNSFTVIGDTRGFSHQHDIRRLPNGNITLYDNGNWLPPLKSRALEFELDEVAMTATLVWDYTDLPDRYGFFMGSVQRRPSGGTMITWGGSRQNPKITDLHPDGSTAFELGFSHPPGFFGSYRGFRAPWKTTRFVTDLEALDFGTVGPGGSAALNLAITSNWASDVAITSFVSTDAAFHVPGELPITIPPGGTVNVNVVFEPGHAGSFKGQLYVRSVSDTELVARRVALEGVSNGPPDCSGAVASVGVLWPANHKLVPVEILGVVDPEGDPVTITVTGVTQNEPVNGTGDGNTCPDAVIGKNGLELRAERSGGGNGRVYEISFLAEDGNGGACEGAVTVCVPHDRGEPDVVAGRGAPVMASRSCPGDGAPQDYDALAACPLKDRKPKPEGVATTWSLGIEGGMVRGNRATVAYTLPEDGDVRLAVYDITGRRVAMVENARRNAGVHRATWDSSALSPGMYFYRLSAGDAVVSRSVLVLK